MGPIRAGMVAGAAGSAVLALFLGLDDPTGNAMFFATRFITTIALSIVTIIPAITIITLATHAALKRRDEDRRTVAHYCIYIVFSAVIVAMLPRTAPLVFLSITKFGEVVPGALSYLVSDIIYGSMVGAVAAPLFFRLAVSRSASAASTDRNATTS